MQVTGVRGHINVFENTEAIRPLLSYVNYFNGLDLESAKLVCWSWRNAYPISEEIKDLKKYHPKLWNTIIKLKDYMKHDRLNYGFYANYSPEYKNCGWILFVKTYRLRPPRPSVRGKYHLTPLDPTHLCCGKNRLFHGSKGLELSAASEGSLVKAQIDKLTKQSCVIYQHIGAKIQRNISISAKDLLEIISKETEIKTT